MAIGNRRRSKKNKIVFNLVKQAAKVGVVSTLQSSTVDWSIANVYTKQITSSETLQFVNDTDGKTIHLVLENTSESPVTVSFPGGLHKSSSLQDILQAGTQSIYTLVKAENDIYITQDVFTDLTSFGDTDGDGVQDNLDAFPNDPTESVDTDGDGVGDNSDIFVNDPTKFDLSSETLIDIFALEIQTGVRLSFQNPNDTNQPTAALKILGTGVNSNQSIQNLIPDINGKYLEIAFSNGQKVTLLAGTELFRDAITANANIIFNVNAIFPKQIEELLNANRILDLHTHIGNILSVSFYEIAVDTDGDGVVDSLDAFPLNALETTDTDGDGVGDNADNAPLIANPDQADLDQDGIADVLDDDIDGDGVINESDAFPFDPTRFEAEIDTDGDGVLDGVDIFPNDSTKSDLSSLTFLGDFTFPNSDPIDIDGNNGVLSINLSRNSTNNFVDLTNYIVDASNQPAPSSFFKFTHSTIGDVVVSIDKMLCSNLGSTVSCEIEFSEIFPAELNNTSTVISKDDIVPQSLSLFRGDTDGDGVNDEFDISPNNISESTELFLNRDFFQRSFKYPDGNGGSNVYWENTVAQNVNAFVFGNPISYNDFFEPGLAINPNVSVNVGDQFMIRLTFDNPPNILYPLVEFSVGNGTKSLVHNGNGGVIEPSTTYNGVSLFNSNYVEIPIEITTLSPNSGNTNIGLSAIFYSVQFGTANLTSIKIYKI